MRLEITDEQYFAMPDVIHASGLSRLKNKGVDFIAEKITPTYDMFLGHAFEYQFHDMVFGSGQFDDHCFVFDADMAMPKTFYGWLLSGEDLEERAEKEGKSRYTKTGKLSSAKGIINLYQWIDACKERQGKTPVSTETIEMLEMQVDSALKIPMHGCTLKEIAERSEYQVAYQYGDLVCLVDILYVDDNAVIPLDLKHVPSLDRLGSKIQDWWIPYCHYTNILRHEFPDHNVEGMEFIAASKAIKDKYYAKRAIIEDTPINEFMWGKYHNTVNNMRTWQQEGGSKQGELGYSETESYRPYIR
jgi:hypothetical protein